jgi:hypothetical protein
MIFKREIENKYIISGLNYQECHLILSDILPFIQKVENGVSTDTFWAQEGVDFIRLRENTKELTVKVSDKGSTQDRIEENLVVEGIEDAARWATAVFGKSIGMLTKAYTVYFLNEGVVSLYMVEGSATIYLEVEAPTVGMVEQLSKYLGTKFDLTIEPRSLYQIFFG